jgi:hypothetical protein
LRGRYTRDEHSFLLPHFATALCCQWHSARRERSRDRRTLQVFSEMRTIVAARGSGLAGAGWARSGGWWEITTLSVCKLHGESGNSLLFCKLSVQIFAFRKIFA